MTSDRLAGTYHAVPDVPSALDAPTAAQVAACRAQLLRKIDDLLVTCTVPFAGARELDALFAALPRVRAQNDRIHFVILGGTPRETARWQRAPGNRQTPAMVTFLAPATPAEFATVLAASDILAAPHCDGASAPMRLLDYLKSGTAIVAMDCAAHRDILAPDAALLTRPAPEAFADGILALGRDPARRHELGLRGRELLAQNRRFDQFRDSLRLCYDYVTSQTTGIAP